MKFSEIKGHNTANLELQGFAKSFNFPFAWGVFGAAVHPARLWQNWLGQSLCSADTVGRVHAGMELEGLRKAFQQIYRRLKRNKALEGMAGWDIAVLDGHEPHTSYRRHCAGCLERTVQTRKGERLQYYHRHVTLMLLTEKLRLSVDLELQSDQSDQSDQWDRNS